MATRKTATTGGRRATGTKTRRRGAAAGRTARVPASRQDASVRDAIESAIADGQRLRSEIEGRINARFAADTGAADTRRAPRTRTRTRRR